MCTSIIIFWMSKRERERKREKRGREVKPIVPAITLSGILFYPRQCDGNWNPISKVSNFLFVVLTDPLKLCARITIEPSSFVPANILLFCHSFKLCMRFWNQWMVQKRENQFPVLHMQIQCRSHFKTKETEIHCSTSWETTGMNFFSMHVIQSF